MNRYATICGFAVAALFNVTAAADPPVETNDEDSVMIPLDQIWAYKMSGTRDVRELERDGENLTGEILQTLRFSKQGQQAKPAFAVRGTGAEALRQAHSVLSKGQRPTSKFVEGSELSVVFFSHQFGYYVQLSEIERRPDAVTIRFLFVPHRTKELTTHFALIPLGTVPPGEIKVEIIRAPMDKALVAAGFKPPDAATESRLVSQSFRFFVETPSSNRKQP